MCQALFSYEGSLRAEARRGKPWRISGGDALKGNTRTHPEHDG